VSLIQICRDPCFGIWPKILGTQTCCKFIQKYSNHGFVIILNGFKDKTKSAQPVPIELSQQSTFIAIYRQTGLQNVRHPTQTTPTLENNEL